jgi:UDP-2,3-diacylglucosamine pyrophosphatase LpxH
MASPAPRSDADHEARSAASSGTNGADDTGRESLLVLSDVHLGSDLNDQLPKAVRRSRAVDEDLIKLLAFYRGKHPSGKRWRLVIAGDFIDFVGMAIRADGALLATEPNDEERAHGLGNAEDHARLKMRRVADRHRDVFAALAAFVSDGHALTIVHGNHDVEFHWDAVKEEFREVLVAEAERGHASVSDGPFSRSAFLDRIEFAPWFFYRGGVVYIEHGHQYDPLCATDYVMAPLSPVDPKRVVRGFSDVLLRFVVRQTRGLKEYGHEHKGLGDYVAFAAQLGIRGMAELGLRFFRAVFELFRVRRAFLSEAAQRLREEHERRMAQLAEVTRIGLDRMRALAALQVPPVTRSILGIMGGVLLDRLALGIAAVLSLAVFLLLGARHQPLWYVAPFIAIAWPLAHWYLARLRPKIDPAEELAERAGHLAKLFPAAFVVMGHTHIPAEVPVNEGAAKYINVGSWAEEEADEPEAPTFRAARTHLVIHVSEQGPVAELLAWDSRGGPRRYVGPRQAPASDVSDVGEGGS